MRINGTPIEADKRYKVASWAPVAEGVHGEPVWEVVAGWLRARQSVSARQANQPRLIGMQGNPGW
jgi:sulfur-oxidizing protein SoxB